MDTVPLLFAYFVVPGAGKFPPMDLSFDVIGVVVDDVIGQGPAAEDGGRITFDYELVGEGGKTFASSEKRGLSYTAAIDADGPDALFMSVLLGAKRGGIRRIFTTGQLLGVVGDGLVPRDEAVTVQVTVRAISGPTNPKVK